MKSYMSIIILVCGVCGLIVLSSVTRNIKTSFDLIPQTNSSAAKKMAEEQYRQVQDMREKEQIKSDALQETRAEQFQRNADLQEKNRRIVEQQRERMERNRK